jgi:hypothetical protein
VVTRRSLKFGSKAGLVAGPVVALAAVAGSLLTPYPGERFADMLTGGFTEGLMVGLAAGLVGVLAVGLSNAFEDPDNTSSLSPAISWRNDLRHAMSIGLIVWLVTWLVTGLAGGLAAGLADDFAAGLAAGLVVALILGLAAGLVAGLGTSHAWPATLAAVQLAMRWHTPSHLMDFLNDAQERNVLRTVGPVYQFRHARLQDQLAHCAADFRRPQA